MYQKENQVPYLNRTFRDELNLLGGFDEFRDYMTGLYRDEDWAGAINYVNYSLLKSRMTHDDGKWKRYWKFAMWVGTMMCCILEVYRRIIAPYEDVKIQENGDV
jgi:hypothetical protein